MQILVIILAIWVRLPIWPFRRDPEICAVVSADSLRRGGDAGD